MRLSTLRRLALSTTAMVLASVGGAAAADLNFKAPPRSAPSAYDWTGFYAGGHLGLAWGTSDWTSPPNSGSVNMWQGLDIFKESGSFFGGIQVGYDKMLPNRVVLGAVADWSFPPFPDPASGLTIGGISTLISPKNGLETYSESMLHFGTVRARLGYSPGNWLLYATGGFAFAYDQLTLTQVSSGTADMPFLWRLGWAAGAGVEVPVVPHWTGGIEYLFADFGNQSVSFPTFGQTFTSNLELQEVRAFLNYRFDEKEAPSNSKKMLLKAPKAPDEDEFNFHGQFTFTEQAYPPIHAPIQGPNSLPASGQGRETVDATLFFGARLWQGAELWINPEIDQGFGIANTHGIAGYSSAEAYKLGSDYPYARIQRFFVRDTIDLGGETEKVDADQNIFAGSQTANRVVLTAGRIAITDLFDTNKYANNSKTDFLNWSVINAGTFDYVGDGWGNTYGAAAEWYQDRWTLRGGVFDTSATPAGGNSPLGGVLDNSFDQFQLVGEIEERHELWGQPGKLKITGYLTRGRMGSYADAIALAAMTGQPADITAVRQYTSRPGVSLNLEQQVSETLGVFARAGWADPNHEPWDFTDIDRTLEAGVSLTGKDWGRPDDTIGVAGVLNNISSVHQAFFNAGGLGILIGDGKLPNPGLEQILEMYYSYALSSSTKLTFDYQFVANPGYNTDNGPVNIFAGRFHWQF
ncbi:MAG TPA: carbohydrate porin [Xanthobacteraceae bacterium]|nr:carbohydrate porin [Xanthobacteraceae bacterium]